MLRLAEKYIPFFFCLTRFQKEEETTTKALYCFGIICEI